MRSYCRCFPLALLVSFACTTTVWAGYELTILADNPVAYYTFDNVTGNVVPDITGNGHNGTANAGCTAGTEAATTTIGGTSMDFDGASGSLSLAGTFGGNSMTGGVYDWSAGTIEAWIKIDTLAPTFQDVVSATTEGFCHFHIVNRTSFGGQAGTFEAGWYTEPHAFFAADAVDPVTTDEWFYLASTRNAVTGDVKLYINGSPVDYVGDFNSTFDYITELSLTIGSGYAGGRFFDGKIDEVAIYNKALTDSQIAAHYAAGNVPEPSTMILFVSGLLFLLVRRKRA